MPLPLKERAQALSDSTPAAKEMRRVVSERIRTAADQLEGQDIMEIIRLPSGAGRRFFQNMMLKSRKSGSSDVQFREGKKYWPEYYFERLGELNRDLQSLLCPPIEPPYEFEAKRKEMMEQQAIAELRAKTISEE